MSKEIRAPRGSRLSCKGWIQEAAMRMLMNNLDPEVAENPDQLVVYGGAGKAARNWECYEAIIHTLKNLENDETLLIQSGKPVGVLKTHPAAPRVLIANANLVPAWATWDHFWDLEKKGLIMFGQMTAGSWIYIGTQGILQGTYETFAELGRQHFGGSLKGKFVLTGGMGGMGGAQPLAVTMAGGVCLNVEVDRSRIERRIRQRYCDLITDSLDEALELVKKFTGGGEAKSIGLVGNAAEIFPELAVRGTIPDVVTDQTSAHDPVNGYVPHGITVEKALQLRSSDPKKYKEMALDSIAIHVRSMLDLQKKGAVVFDYWENAFDFPGFVPAYIRPLFCEGMGPFRWAALSGDPEDIFKTDEVVLREFSYNQSLVNWIRLARKKVAFQGLPARICWLNYGERARFGAIINNMVASGELKAPIVIGRDHLDCGSVASPNRETESMLDGSDAGSDWPILNALVNTAAGASWVSFHHGGGVGMGYAQHAGMVVVADGTPEAAERLQRVLTTDAGMGILRHVDAGYEKAIQVAKEKGVKIPMLKE